MEAEDIKVELEKLADRIEKGELLVAESKSLYETLDEQKKNILSELMLQSESSSMSKAEAEARSTAEWKNFVSELKDARSDYNKKKATLNGLYLKHSTYITILSFEKAKINIQ